MKSFYTKVKMWLQGAVKSFTIWFNAVCAVVAGVITDLPTVLPDLAPVLPADVYKWLLFLNILGNFALRAKTKLPLYLK